MLKTITAYPYAKQVGTLNVPDDLSEDEEQKYITEHFSEISFEEPKLDYIGTDFDID